MDARATARLAAPAIIMAAVLAGLARGKSVQAPLFNALARVAGIGASDAFLLVVPAVVRYAIPEASAGLYFGMALVVTFPFNIVFGLPLYYTGITIFWR